jgi:O-succinylbenzoic acid--CoA ligase
LLPFYHVSGLLQLVRSFATGGQIRFSDALAEGDCVSLVPTQLQRILDDRAGVERLRVARAVFIGGAAISEAVATRARELRLPLVPAYGMTETAAMVAAVSTDDFLKGSNAGARPLGRARISVDPDGGIRIWTPALFKGYHGREALDLSKGFRTGDRGYFDDQGGLHVLGRIDDLINTGGEKVDPAEVECALLRMDGIEAAHVTGEPDAEWGQVVVAYLSPFKIPKRFEWVDTIGACQV